VPPNTTRAIGHYARATAPDQWLRVLALPHWWTASIGLLLLPFNSRLLQMSTLLGPGPGRTPMAAKGLCSLVDPSTCFGICLLLADGPLTRANVFSQQSWGTAGGAYPFLPAAAL